MSQSKELFAAAEGVWDLAQLYSDLAKTKGSRLTEIEQTNLRGLLLGFAPQDIAQHRYIDANGLRVELSRTVYRYVADLVDVPKSVNSRTLPHLLEPKYRKISRQTVQPYLSAANQFDIPGGQMPLHSPFYIDRPPIEQDCFREILRPGALIRINAPRQTGKSSLLARILNYAEQQGCETYCHSLHLADQEDFKDLTTFLQRFCANISRGLGLPLRIGELWDSFLGSKMNCKVYFEQYLLQEISTPLIIGLDEVDRLFQYPELAADFLGMLRAWYEEAKIREIWQKFRLVIVYSTEVYLPLDHSQSPFNVGLQVMIPDFRPHQTWELVRLYELGDWRAEHIEQLISLIGGHPYLAQVALSEITSHHLTLEQLLDQATYESGLFGGHLIRYLRLLRDNPELMSAMATVVASPKPVRLDLILAHRLSSLGLVLIQKRTQEVVIRCELYRLYFRDRLPPP